PFPFHLKAPRRVVGKGIGHFFGALRIDGFIDPDEFKRRVDEWIRVFRATKPAPGTSGTLIPGDPERMARAHHSREGRPPLSSVVKELCELASVVGIPFH